MATQNKTGTTVVAGVPEAQIPYTGLNKVYVLKNTIDLTGALPDADAEVYQCLPIPANTSVLEVKVKMVTAATGTTNAMDIGDASGADSWDATINMKASAGTWTHSTDGTDAYQPSTGATGTGGKWYGTADTIDATIDATTTQDGLGPKFTIYALCVDYN